MAFTCAVKNCSNGGYWLNKWKKQLCTVCGCLHSEKHCKCNPPFRLFSFPTQKRNPEGRLRWKQLVNRINGNKMWSPSKDSRVCSKHFLEGEPTLQNPFPTLHLGYDEFESKVKRIMFFRDESDSSCKVTYMTVDDPQYTTSPYHPDPPVEMLSLKVEFPWQLTLLAVINVLLQTLAIVNKQLQSVKSENTRLKQEIALLKRKRYVDSILKSDEDVNYFTGLPSKSVFEKFHKVIAPLVNRRWLGVKGGLQHVRKFANEPSRFGPERKLSSRAEFLLTLMRLRLGLLGKDLAVRFDISESLCGRIFLAWLRACSKVFGSMVYIPDEETLIATKPEKFKHISDLHSIIDCTEIFIETPKDLDMQSSSWSNYKSHNTLKVLVACAPNSAIVFISAAYTGRMSDKQVTLDSGFLDHIPQYSVIMADKGFNINHECAMRNISLYVPPGRRGQSQMHEAAVRKTKKKLQTLGFL